MFNIFNSNIELNSQFNDLGIIYDSKLNFSLFTEMLNNKAIHNLGFIKRTYSSFINPIPLNILYCSLVCSHLEYCLLI